MRPNHSPTLPAPRSAALMQPLHLISSPRLPPAEHHSRRQQPTREGTRQHRPFIGSSISFSASHSRRSASPIPLGAPAIVVVEWAGSGSMPEPTTLGIPAVTSNEVAHTEELYPSIAAVAAIRGDPSGIYADFLANGFPGYASEAYFLWNQYLGGG
ncbi:hypothetical protein LshimejAT787_0700930 [Lyophyllum shimeji]|uniref:Uncharacterized protein n=1 Tax=Lyophyllum shimeji TaxID=47721 RepID=A0A9P3PPB1_LYOSH|nr:hypothetical protein LshimejAT787_0700930 [Lyophyllum shimeji]